MRIAVIHSFYSSKQPSGENSVVIDQVDALTSAGYEVMLFDKHTDHEINSFTNKIKTAADVATGRGYDPTNDLNEFQPDIVHIHNLFPNIGTTWLYHWKGPVVVSVHNYRAVCSNGLLFRDGKPCDECVTHGSWRAVVHKCYRNSAIATIPLALSRSRYGTYLLERAERVVTTSKISENVLLASVPIPIKTIMIPNFGSSDGQDPIPSSNRSGWVAAGRLSAEKGFMELIDLWPPDHHLTLIGSGELDQRIHSKILGRNISIVPSMSRNKLRQILPQFIGFIFPSRWTEAAPQVVVEAMGVGLPVITWEGNAVAQLVSESHAGKKYHDAPSLASALKDVSMFCDTYSEAAVSFYREVWSRKVWLRAVSNLYQQLMPSGEPGSFS